MHLESIILLLSLLFLRLQLLSQMAFILTIRHFPASFIILLEGIHFCILFGFLLLFILNF